LKLLLQLEDLIGNECYNGNIQNWGPGGEYEGEGREFRYPITFVDAKGDKVKRKHADMQLEGSVAKTGYYAFGANQLHIIQGLDKVLKYLEQNCGLKIETKT
jgi:hypothetical protein